MSAEKRARELLADVYGRRGLSNLAQLIEKDGFNDPVIGGAAEAVTAALTHQWQDISTAPRDGTRILCVTRGRVGIRYWNYQRFHANPRPFWDDDNPRWGISYCRQNPPTHWLPLPAPPEGEA